MEETLFPADFHAILKRMETVDVVAYAETRNFTDGHVSRLSPYISRGVISLKKILTHILQRYKKHEAATFIKELAWREYWQRVWENRGEDIFTDLKQSQTHAMHHAMPTSVMHGSTGIAAIDQSIALLKETGYMHNHMRMYVAAITCNRGRSHWLLPSRWMYYHLLDADIASNTLSWQWVAGTFSAKPYWCNQENINHYTKTRQHSTFMDYPYECLPAEHVPVELSSVSDPELPVRLPVSDILPVNAKKVFVYNSYNLDPEWHTGESGVRILLLEPEHFRNYPVSPLVMSFIISLTKNISDIFVFSGSFNEMAAHYPGAEIIFKKHPASTHYRGTAEDPEYLFPDVAGYFPSFSSYWKKCQRQFPAGDIN